MRWLALVAVLAAVAVAGAAAAWQDAPSRPPGLPRGVATIATAAGEVRVHVEIASTPGQRARGLMHRSSLAADAGMVFRFPQASKGAFWMKSTLIPLDIAFYDASGRILRILRMEPCEQDPCPTYPPGVAYRGALEVNAGALAEWGVREGDRITVTG